MPRLTILERTELAAIPVVVAIAWFLPLGPAFSLKIGELITAAALVLLLQGFCRDVWLWFAARRERTGQSEPHHAQCLCVESAVGLTGVIIAAGLTAFSLGPSVALTGMPCAAGVGVVLIGGFLLKDFVFEWSPWRIYRVKDHASLHFRWKR